MAASLAAGAAFDNSSTSMIVSVTAAFAGSDTLKAEEIHILPVHVGEGSYPWDHHPDGGTKTAGSMTNGTVAVVHGGAPTVAGSMTNGTVTASNSMSLKVTYRGAEMVNGKCTGHAPMTPTGAALVTIRPSEVSVRCTGHLSAISISRWR